MRRILDLLGLTSASGPGPPKSAALRRIVDALEHLEPERAQYLAAFAYLLGRVAHADLDTSHDELREIERIVARYGDLPADQAQLVTEIARCEQELDGGTQNFQVAREFRQIASREERRELLHCLFAVSAADNEISGAEEKQVRQVAEELGFSHREFIEVRSSYNHQRSVVQRLQQEDPKGG